MLKIIRNLLQQIIDDIDSNNSNISERQQFEVIKFIQKINTKELSKLGQKRIGFKGLSWNKCDLDKFLEKQN